MGNTQLSNEYSYENVHMDMITNRVLPDA